MVSPKQNTITHDKHEMDANGQILGRLATKIATLLTGKSKNYFVRHLDCGDFVNVTNASKVVVTGKKADQKKYGNYSGYPGGLKEKTYKQVMKEKPEEILRHAVYGMLPNNKLRDRWIRRLTIHA